jgi:hypothetical protein
MGYYTIRENEDFVIESPRETLRVICSLGRLRTVKIERDGKFKPVPIEQVMKEQGEQK